MGKRPGNTPETRAFGRRLRELRRAAGMLPEELAKAARLSPRTVRRAESGHQSVSLATLYLFARGLGVGVAEFFPPAEGEPDDDRA